MPLAAGVPMLRRESTNVKLTEDDKILLDNVEWNFDSIDDWRREKARILSLPMKGKDKEANLKRVNEFIVQSLDYLADPTIDRKIPMEIFEIGQIMSIKIKGSDGEEFQLL